jgi:uncharacterized protein (TIGR03437 family)
MAPHFFSPDGHTRIALFAKNLKLLPVDGMSAVMAQAEVAQHGIVPLQVEFVGVSPQFQWLTQVNVKLPNELQGAGDVPVSITLRGIKSNEVLISVAP